MAGRGPAPKEPEQRAGHIVPKRGEWQDLPKTRRGPIPVLPKREQAWKARTRAAWKAWWRDPAATQWTPADVDSVLALAELVDLGAITIQSEIRLRMDGLGLTQKGKRDLRWRVMVEEAPAAKTSKRPSAPTLRLVDDAVSA